MFLSVSKVLPQGLDEVLELCLFWPRLTVKKKEKQFRKCVPISSKRDLSSRDTASG